MTALLLFGALLRVLFLGVHSIEPDEANTLALAALSAGRLLALVKRLEVTPPLYFLLMRVWTRAFADPLIATRLFSALCGLASLAAFRALAERVLPARARPTAVFFAAFSSYWIHLAQDGRVYSPLLLVSLLATIAAWDLLQRPSPRRWAAYAALAALGLYCHYYFAVLLFAQAVWLAGRFRARPRELLSLAAALAGAGLLFAPWLPGFLAQFRASATVPYTEHLTPARWLDLLGTSFFDVSFLGLLLPHWLPSAACAALLLASATAVLSSRRRGFEAGELRAWVFCAAHLTAAAALVIAAEALVGRPVTQARYMAPLSPFLFLAAGLALSAPGQAARAAKAALGALLVAGTAGYFASNRWVDPHLSALSSAMRATDRRLPLVYVETYYYLPMRAYYLPERAHFLAGPAAVEMANYTVLPPYDGVLDPERLRRLGPCVVMDEKRLLGGPPRWLGTGAQVASLLAATK